MINERTYQLSIHEIISLKRADYFQLIKFRLSILVVFSCAMGYLYAAGGHIIWDQFLFLLLGGLLVTWSSNALNQVLEKEVDKKMSRTSSRPLPQERMTLTEALLAGVIFGITGLALLWHFTNPVCTLLAALALVLYVFVYTPLKVHPIAVAAGAIPGAMPVLLGMVTVSGSVGVEAIILFSIQFIWQFPHTWAIAWLGHEDYQKAGYKMLPSSKGKDKYSALQVAIYTFFLLPVGILPFVYGIYEYNAITLMSLSVVFCLGLFFFYRSIQFYNVRNNIAARKVLFASFAYLPLAQMALVLDKMFI